MDIYNGFAVNCGAVQHLKQRKRFGHGRAKLMITTNGDPPAKQRNTIEAKWALLLIENLPQALPRGRFSINSNSRKIMFCGRRHDCSPFVSAFRQYRLWKWWHPRVLSLPIISCRRRPEHLSISSLPASELPPTSDSAWNPCTNFGQLRELLSKPWRSSANTRKMLLLIQIFCGTYITWRQQESIYNGFAVNCGAVQHLKQRKRFGHGRAKLMITTHGDPPAKQRNTIEAKWALLLIENLPQALPRGRFSINSNSRKILFCGRRHDMARLFSIRLCFPPVSSLEMLAMLPIQVYTAK